MPEEPGIELISIHIPKTAGTSFRNTLTRVYGEEGILRVDIELPAERVPFRSTEPAPETLPPSVKVIHGHFRMRDLRDKYGLSSRIPVITWLREPVERVISNFYYLQKILKEIVDEEGRRVNILQKMQKSLLEYARTDVNRNRMSRFLEGMALDDFLFVGIREHIDEDLQDLARLLGWETFEVFHDNVTGGSRDEVSQETREEIAELNRDDVELYDASLRYREDRRRKTEKLSENSLLERTQRIHSH